MSEQQPGELLVRLSGVSKSFGSVVAVEPLDLTIHRGDFFAVLGPSGCGKTTLLNVIAGFLAPSSGTVEIAGQDVTRLGPERRPTNMVFQGYGLFPHMNVRQNIAYGLRIRRTSKEEIESRVREVIQLVHLEGFEERPVQELSGGQQQRVVLARALIMRPQVLLLDEPLAALDLKLRKAMQLELRRIHDSIGGTFVFVTHDQSEAMSLANRIAVMQDGKLVQEGSAEDLYQRPKTRFVSTFIGDGNVFPGERRNHEVQLNIGLRFAAPGENGRVVSVVRPESIRLTTKGEGLRDPNNLVLQGRVENVVYLGTHIRYEVLVDGEPITVHTAVRDCRSQIGRNTAVVLAWSREDQNVLPDQ